MARPRSIDRERVAHLIGQGLNDGQIAEQLGTRNASITRVRNELASGSGRYQPVSRAKSIAEQDEAFQAALGKGRR